MTTIVEQDDTRVMRQYADESGYVITGQMYAEQDAHTVTWFTADGCVWLSLTRSPRGLWGIETSDYVLLAPSHYRKRFGSPDEALQWANERTATDVVEVDDWLADA